jgi:hypothetical protein
MVFETTASAVGLPGRAAKRYRIARMGLPLGQREVIHYSYFPDVAATREVDMWKPWQWGHGSHEAALTNAREAATELSRRRVERDDVELYLAQRSSVARLSSRRA